MRAVVLEIREKKAAVMTLEGNVILVDDKGYVIGQEIDVRADEIATPGFSERFLRYIPAVAAAAETSPFTVVPYSPIENGWRGTMLSSVALMLSATAI